VVVGGLNPIAILEEQEYRVFSQALSGLFEYDQSLRHGILDAIDLVLARRAAALSGEAGLVFMGEWEC